MGNSYTIILFYKYTNISDTEALKLWHLEIGRRLNLTGRVIIATEGINSTLEGKNENIEKYIEELRELPQFSDVPIKKSEGIGNAFPKLKVKVRPEIVAAHLGEEDVNPEVLTGDYLTPEELKTWYESGKDFTVVDMRNDYEFKSGHFKDSIHPGIENFRELPDALPSIDHLKEKTVVTVCTGGVRCEKASGFLKQKGFKNVFQLHGGMHNYMEKYPGEDFLGTLFTFDNRVTMHFGGEREIVGRCSMCNKKTENFSHCNNIECHKKMLKCEDCEDQGIKIFCKESCRVKHFEDSHQTSSIEAW